MKLNGSMLVAVALMVGSLGALGCNKVGDSAVAPEETAADAPEVDADGNAVPGSPGFEQNSLRLRMRYYAPYAPPRARFETRGRSPSARHFWAPGYHRWNGRQHVWVRGRWEPSRSGYVYVSPRWENRSSRWMYVPGRWVRR